MRAKGTLIFCSANCVIKESLFLTLLFYIKTLKDFLRSFKNLKYYDIKIDTHSINWCISYLIALLLFVSNFTFGSL